MSVASGDWSSASTWQIFNGTSWVAATAAPSNTDGVITIAGTNTVNVTTTVDADQVVIAAGAELDISGSFFLMNGTGTDLTANGNIRIESSGKIYDDPSIGGSTIDYKNAELYTGGGLSPLITFDGSTAQTIDGPGYFTYITLNNANNLTITGGQGLAGVNFVSGRIIVTGTGAVLISQYSGNFTGQGPTSFIDGPVDCILYDATPNRTFTLPIGKNGHYWPMVLTAQQDANNETQLLVSVTDGTPPANSLSSGITNVSDGRYVTITRNATSSNITASLQLSYDATDGVTDPTALRVAEAVAGSGTWTNLGGTGSTAGSGTITSGSFAELGDFALANTTESWTGTADANWNNAANWFTGSVPVATDEVSIPTGTTFSPVISSAATANDVTVANGATLTVAAAGTLSIAGSIYNSGTLDASAGALTFNGTAAQTVNGNIAVNNLTINNTAGVSLFTGTTTVYGVYTPTAGTLTTNGNLVLSSTASNTASIAQSSVANYVAGNVTVQRYIPAHRAWRLLTTPLSNTGTIYANWQNNGVINGNTGALMFAPGGTGSSGNGFTAGGGEASIESYDAVSNTWVGLSNTTSTLLSGTSVSAANTGFGLFVTGPYGSTNILPATGAAATTLSATGNLQTGAQQFNYTGLAAGNYILAANPYASPINFTQIGATGAASGNINNTMWAWDAQRGKTSYGGYVTFSWDATANGGAGGYDQDIAPGSTAQTINIQSGEAFFVQAVNAGTATVTINETDKAPVSTITGGVFGVQPSTPAQQMRISLNSGGQQVDGVLAKFGEAYKPGITDDAAKLYDYDENLSLQIDTNYLAIERRPLPAAGDTIWLSTYALKKNAEYAFSLNPENMTNPDLKALLVDKYTGTATQVSLDGNTTVNFATGSDAGSLSQTRFNIIFQTNGILAVATTVNAWAVDNDVQVEWTVPAELGVKQYQVQRSANGQSFTQQGTAITARNTGNKEVYDFTDATPLAGNNYYRIQTQNNDGTVSYSNVALVKAVGTTGFNIYPNPVPRNGQLQASFNNMAAGKYVITVYSISGKTLVQQTIQHAGGSIVKTIALPAGLATGSYRVVLEDGNGKTWKQQVVAE